MRGNNLYRYLTRFNPASPPTVSSTLAARVPSKTGLRRGTDIGGHCEL